jgi:glyoxylase-like metal-dependent hydrolase (beta-lactamase superfamily II)
VTKTSSHRFKIGDIDCVAVLDSIRPYPVRSLLSNAPGPALRQALEAHNIRSEEIDVPYICLAARTAEGWTLVDTGLGADEEDPSYGRLLVNLKEAGIQPEEVGTVILTHGHGDHIGGTSDDESRPIYPNARYVMHRDEWDFWTSEENLRGMGSPEAILYIRARLTDLQDRFDLIEGESEIAPGIRAVPAVGHTPGHLVVSIASRGESLLYISDLVAHPIQVERPDWAMVFDRAPERAAETRRRVLEAAAAEGTLVHAFHFPFPGLGHIVREGEGLRWRPIV